MKRSQPHVETSLAVRLGCAAGAAALSAVILGTLVGAMAPLGQDAGFAAATDVAIVPARIEVVGRRLTTTAQDVAAPHVG